LDLIAAERLTGVTLAGPTDPHHLADLFHQAELFLCSASFDDLPLAPFEALAFGLPVITTDAGALPDFLTDRKTAFLVPLNDHVALADRILTLTDNPDQAGRLAATGRLLAEQLNRRLTSRLLQKLYSPDLTA
jgi:glycosyltransferase involved in cell wall biosynthesis